MQVARVAPDWLVPSLMHRRRVVGDRITYVGLDVHKGGIVVAVVTGGIRGEVREYGRIANTTAALDRLAGKLSRDGERLRFCYEAGPCGYGIQRHLPAGGYDCVVVASSLTPKRAGDHVKTDRRDAANLARLHRAGELTAVWVPDPGHEAMRDLVRVRLDAVRALRRAREQPSGFLLRRGCHYRRPAWSKLHRRWLAGLKFEQAVHHLVLEDYVQTIEAAQARRDRLTAHVATMLPEWTLAPVVSALLTMRGMALVNAATLNRRIGRPVALCQSAPADGLSRAGTVGAFERSQRQTRRPHQACPWRRTGGRQQCRPSPADRGGLVLPLPGPGQPRA